MSSDDALTMSALKFVCGESKHVCRLCFSVTEKGEVSIEDYVRVQTFYNNETVTFITMFQELGVSLEPLLPRFICISCATLIINTYNFHKLIMFSNNKWNEVIDRLNDSLVRSDIIQDNIKSIYLMINKKDNIMFTNRRKMRTNTQGSKRALAKAKEVIRNKKRLALTKVKEVIRNKKKYLQVKDKPTEIVCKECGEKFSSRIPHLRHMRMHNVTSNPCKKCPKIFSTPEQLEKHNERLHRPKRIPCSKCAKMFSTERMLRAHIRVNHIKTTCKVCSQQLPSQKDLRTHMDKHWLNKCPYCKKCFYNRHSYMNHLKICGDSEKEPAFFCDICNKGYLRKNGIQSHLKTEHGFGNVLECNWCDKKFDAVSKLREHVVKHTGERNFTCNLCDGKFVTQAALLYHIRLHTGEKPYTCDYCDETFVSASRRLTHIKRKHLEPTLECHICHIKFAMNNALRKHVRRHSMPNSKLYVPQEE